MENFFIAFKAVLVMAIYALPGYLLMKSKKINESVIPQLSVLLMYICNSFLAIYAFGLTKCTNKLLKEIGIFFVVSVFLVLFMLFMTYFILVKNCTIKKTKDYDKKEVLYRVATVASSFGNVAFIGIPLITALLPNYPQAPLFSLIFTLTNNFVGYTVASAVITDDKSYISIKKVILNPATISCAIGFLLFFFNVELPYLVDNSVTALANMSTPLCMLIIGMRLGTMKFKSLFTEPVIYLIIVAKQIIMPLIAFLLIQILPIDENVGKCLFILSSTPIAAIVLTFSEMLKKGQDSAAKLVVLGTTGCIITIPVMMLLL